MWIYDYKNDLDNPIKEPPFVEITNLSYADNLPQWVYPFHIHDDSYEIAFIMTGSGSLLLDDLSCPMAPGSVVIIPPMRHHRFVSDSAEGMTYYSIRFRKKDDGSELQEFLKDCDVTFSGGNDPSTAIHLIDALFSIHAGNGGRSDAAFQAAALSLILTAKEMLAHADPFEDSEEHETASAIMKYIMETDGAHITLESLSKHFNISQSHISRIFNDAYHVSPINYAITARVTYATELLLKTDMTVVAIAEKMGYDNPAHFTNMFIKRIGCSPSEYQERNMRMPKEKGTE